MSKDLCVRHAVSDESCLARSSRREEPQFPSVLDSSDRNTNSYSAPDEKPDESRMVRCRRCGDPIPAGSGELGLCSGCVTLCVKEWAIRRAEFGTLAES